MKLLNTAFQTACQIHCLTLLAEAAAPSNATPPTCTDDAITLPSLFGAEILSLSAFPVRNFSASLPQADQHFALNITQLDFCNVSIQYTHPGWQDRINVQVWLPLSRSDWNERFMGTGGAGYATELAFLSLPYAVSLGYSAVATEGGHPSNYFDPSSWALSSPGNVNWFLLQDFAAVALDDAATIGKAVTSAYYGSSATYSYWNGCSSGGRQGLMMAQRYPTQYDGIMAAAPVIEWEKAAVGGFSPQLIMNQLGIYPSECELEAITAAATAACDELDGVADAIIAAPGLCHFDPYTVVNQTFPCTGTGTTTTVTTEAATVALAIWTGSRSTSGAFQWWGLNPDAALNVLAPTDCLTGNCPPDFIPFHQLFTSWLTYFVAKNPAFNLSAITPREYDTLFRQSTNQYASILGTADPDLTDLRAANAKLIIWHGLADALIPPNATVEYYERVLERDGDAADFVRLFTPPGLGHCGGGVGYYPDGALQALVDWVEEGIAPESLLGRTLPDAEGKIREAPLCPYPLVAAYRGGDRDVAGSFRCQDSF